MQKKSKIPEPTIARLPVYFRCLMDLKNSDVTIISSEELSYRAGVKASQFRKDLSYFGEFGIQGLGYPVLHLLDRISAIMQLNRKHNAVLVGVGNLGNALVHYPGFSRWGFHITRLFDKDPSKIGTMVEGIVIEDIDRFSGHLNAQIGIIAVPSDAAQETGELLVEMGVKAILNFTGKKLELGSGIVVRNVDLTHELAILTYHLSALKGK